MRIINRLRTPLALILLIGCPLFATAQNWTLAIEAGNGTLFNTSATYQFLSKLEAGCGAGLDFHDFNIADEVYRSTLMNFHLILGYRLVQFQGVEIQTRVRPGFNYLRVGEFSTSGFELSPELLAGYRNAYLIFSGILMFTDVPTFLPQLGLGYRFRFGGNKK